MASFSFFGNVMSMASVQLAGAKRDALLLSFKDAKVGMGCGNGGGVVGVGRGIAWGGGVWRGVGGGGMGWRWSVVGGGMKGGWR